MDAGANPIFGKPTVIADGPLKGWITWSHGQDPYKSHVGVFACRVEGAECASAFLPERRHMNGSGAIHGGALMSFADFALFSIGHNALQGGVSAVTLTMNAEFVSAGAQGIMAFARGEVIRETGGLLFARGLVTQDGKPLLSFSGTLKKIRPRPAQD